MKTFFLTLVVLSLNLQLTTPFLTIFSLIESNLYITSDSGPEFDDEEGSEEEQENEEIEENA